MRALDLFAGAGGLSLGLARAGFEVLGVELDRDATRTHARHAGPVVRADVSRFSLAPSARFDLVAGGSPCQSFSLAGRRGGLADPRGQLWRHLLRLGAETRARALLLENVPAAAPLLLPVLLPLLEREGWRVCARVKDASAYGVPQRRRRLFVVGFREEAASSAWRWPVPTHGEGGLGLEASPVSVREALGLAGPYKTGRREGAKGWQGERYVEVDRPARTIGASSAPDLLDKPAPTVTASEARACGSRFGSRGGRAAPRHAGDILGAALEQAGLLDRPATTVAAAAAGRLPPAGHHERQLRGAVRLSVAQCAALQGFPPGWRWEGTKASQYRQVGNAVPPPLAEALGGAIGAALRAR